MKLIYQCEEKEERRNLEDFLRFYEDFKNIKIEDVVSCPDRTNRTEKSPDYYLSNLDIAVEIKQIVVEKFQQVLRAPDKRVTEISNLINNYLNKSAFGDDFKKRIIIRCPRSFNKIKRSKYESFAQSFVGKLICDRKIFQERNYNFEVEFITGHDSKTKQEERINLFFSVLSISESERPEVDLYAPVDLNAIWALDTIQSELKRMISEASAIFISYKSSKTILLLIDYYLGNKDDYNECLNDDLKIKLLESTIDEVWVQFRATSGICLDHNLLWSKD